MFHNWEFTTDTGEKIIARFTDTEIADMKIKYPTVIFRE